MRKEQGLIVETLFVGLTRPTTLLLVPYSAVVFEVMIIIQIFIWSHNIFSLLLFIPVHGIFYLLCLKEPRIFELLLLWGQTKGATLFDTWVHWRSSTYSPLPLDVGRDKKYLLEKDR